MKTLRFSLVVSAMLAAAGAAHAADGVVTIDGEVTANTCTLNSGDASKPVSLLPVPASSLASAGATAGAKKFELKIVGCPLNTTAYTYFETSGAIASTAGKLKNTFTGTNKAANVEIQLRNWTDGSVIDLSKTATGSGASGQNVAQMTATTSDGTGTTTYNATQSLLAEYYATGVATTGKVLAVVPFTMVYN